MSLKPKIEAIIYAADEPITLDQLCALLKDEVMAELPLEPPVEVGVVTATDDATIEEATPVPVESATETPVVETAPAETATADGDGLLTSPTSSEPALTETAAEAASEAGTAPDQPTPDEQVQTASAEISTAAAVAPAKSRRKKVEIPPQVKSAVRASLEELIADYNSPERGMEIRHVAGGYRMATKPEHHELVRSFAKSLKPPMRLSLPALETLAVIAYKQPITAPEISDIRGVDSSGVVATLLDRKLITTGGRKAVIGRPILYKTTKEFLLRFGLNDVGELPSMEEFEKLAQEAGQVDMFEAPEPAEVTNGKHAREDDASEHEPTTEAEPDKTEEQLTTGATEDSASELTAPVPASAEAPEIAESETMPQQPEGVEPTVEQDQTPTETEPAQPEPTPLEEPPSD